MSFIVATAPGPSNALRRMTPNKRMLLPVVLMALLMVPGSRQVTLQVLSDAFFQVGIFVYLSLVAFHAVASRVSGGRMAELIARYPAVELSGAALLGALPGCGGAIVVVTQFVRGNASFGAVVTVLTSTMGDAAFLLLASEPVTGLSVMAISSVVGVITGAVVNYIHQDDSVMRQPAKASNDNVACQCEGTLASPFASRFASYFFLVLAIPALIIALFMAFNVDIQAYSAVLNTSIVYGGASAAFITIVLWAINGQATAPSQPNAPAGKLQVLSAKAAADTQFVLSWVVVAFLLFELPMFWFNVDMAAAFDGMGVVAVLGAIAVGMLPGCGPQIMVTGLYLQGALPFAALLGNGLANDGDALFPAMALAPKAAAYATLYSAVPALVVGLGWFYLVG